MTLIEFRNAIRKLGLGITSREIDQLMTRIDTNGDGRIDYYEFAAKFKDTSFDARMAARASNRMAKLKELMNLHMTSANDAFRFVSEKFENSAVSGGCDLNFDVVWKLLTLHFFSSSTSRKMGA